MGEKMRSKQARRLRQVTIVLGVCLLLYLFFFVSDSPGDDELSRVPIAQHTSPQWRPRLSEDVLNNLSLDEKQCNTAFPGLTKEIDDVVAEGPFKVKDTGDLGPLQGRIKDGQLYVINAQRRADLSKEMLNSRTSALHQLHRALLTSPSPIPDTVFTLNFQDQPFGTAWTYSRPADPSLRSQDPDARNFPMPHFSFWAWSLPFIGSMDAAAARIAAIEQSLPFRRKTPKAAWRGTAWFNSAHSPHLRQHLLRAAKDQPWADVQELEWNDGQGGGSSARNASNALRIEDFCRYKYAIHTEGVAYSGRFQFLQMCASVTLTAPIMWMQHTTHLVRPLFSSDLDLSSSSSSSSPDSLRAAGGETHAKRRWAGSGAGAAGGGSATAKRALPKKAAWEASARVRAAWPKRYPPEQANIVFVAPDWADLGDTIAWLERHPQVAEGIARRQRELFVGGGYFSPAAEACYWRALVRGWAKVARTEGMEWDEKGKLGKSFEEFILGHEK